MKVAYWPGCVSRGFTPELHGSMAQVAPLLDIELVELDRACCTGAGVIGCLSSTAGGSCRLNGSPSGAKCSSCRLRSRAP